MTSVISSSHIVYLLFNRGEIQVRFYFWRLVWLFKLKSLFNSRMKICSFT